jgi:prolipoprotein diacylglyceryltransferase
MISLSIPGPGDNTIGVGPLELPASAVMIAIGVVVAVGIARRRWAARRGNGDDIAALSVWAVPAVGARLHHVITDRHRVEGGWSHAPAVWEGGLGNPPWSDRRSAGRGAAAFHPTFPYEAARNLVPEALLVAIERRWRPRPGQLLSGYAAGRFWAESLGVVPATELWGVRVNLWVSAAPLFAAVTYCAVVQAPRSGHDDGEQRVPYGVIEEVV